MNLSHLLIDTCYHAARSSTPSSHGDPSFGTATAIACRVEHARTLRPEEVSFSHRIFTEAAVSVGDRLWLPGDATTAALARPVQEVRRVSSLNGGTTLYEVLL